MIPIGRSLRDAYGKWLGQEPFDAFLTITHDAEGTLSRRPQKLLTAESRVWRVPRRCHPEQLVKRFYLARSIFNTRRYGREWRKHDGQAMSAVLGVERHLSHSAHGHALLRVPGGIDQDELRLWQRVFTDTGGFCKLEIPRCQQDTMDYVCKYVCKDDSLEFTPNFEPVTRQRLLGFA